MPMAGPAVGSSILRDPVADTLLGYGDAGKEIHVTLATAEAEQQRLDVQFGGLFGSDTLAVWFDSEPPSPTATPVALPDADSPVRAMYARLAEAYEAEPAVSDHGGGVQGDRFPIDR
jgi:hypothetical protein